MKLFFGALGLVGFQFLNPKSWLLVLTVLAAMPATDAHDYLLLVAMFVLIPTLCLWLWAALVPPALALEGSRHDCRAAAFGAGADALVDVGDQIIGQPHRDLLAHTETVPFWERRSRDHSWGAADPVVPRRNSA